MINTMKQLIFLKIHNQLEFRHSTERQIPISHTDERVFVF